MKERNEGKMEREKREVKKSSKRKGLQLKRMQCQQRHPRSNSKRKRTQQEQRRMNHDVVRPNKNRFIYLGEVGGGPRPQLECAVEHRVHAERIINHACSPHQLPPSVKHLQIIGNER